MKPTILAYWTHFSFMYFPETSREASELEMTLARHAFYSGFGACLDIIKVAAKQNISGAELRAILMALNKEWETHVEQETHPPS